MTMTSASASPPHMVNKPSRTQAAIAQPKFGTAFATSAGFLNTPAPMTLPTTTAVVIHGPRTRTRCAPVVESVESEKDFMNLSGGSAEPDGTSRPKLADNRNQNLLARVAPFRAYFFSLIAQ